jgi:hypothetical protein
MQMAKKHHGSKHSHQRGQHSHLSPIVVAAAGRQQALLPSAAGGNAEIGWWLSLALGLLLTAVLWRVNQDLIAPNTPRDGVAFGQLAILCSALATLFVFLRLVLAEVPALWDRICRAYLRWVPPAPISSPLPVERPTTHLPGTPTRRLDPADLLGIAGSVSRETKTHHLPLLRP